jgi:hypothetical protein
VEPDPRPPSRDCRTGRPESTDNLQLNPGSAINQAQSPTPFGRSVIAGATATLIARSPKRSAAPRPWNWSGWSDGSVRVHQVTVNAATTYTASFDRP